MIKVGDIVHHYDDRPGEDFLVIRTYASTKHLSRYGGVGRLPKGICSAIPLLNGEVESRGSHFLPEKKLTKIGHFDGDIDEILSGNVTSIHKKRPEKEFVEDQVTDYSDTDFWDLFDA